MANEIVGDNSAPDEIDPNDLRGEIIQTEREKYLRGEGASFTWNEVKNMALNKRPEDGRKKVKT